MSAPSPNTYPDPPQQEYPVANETTRNTPPPPFSLYPAEIAQPEPCRHHSFSMEVDEKTETLPAKENGTKGGAKPTRFFSYFCVFLIGIFLGVGLCVLWSNCKQYCVPCYREATLKPAVLPSEAPSTNSFLKDYHVVECSSSSSDSD